MMKDLELWMMLLQGLVTMPYQERLTFPLHILLAKGPVTRILKAKDLHNGPAGNVLMSHPSGQRWKHFRCLHMLAPLRCQVGQFCLNNHLWHVLYRHLNQVSPHHLIQPLLPFLFRRIPLYKYRFQVGVQ